jgi:hypothetical protein
MAPPLNAIEITNRQASLLGAVTKLADVTQFDLSEGRQGLTYSTNEVLRHISQIEKIFTALQLYNHLLERQRVMAAPHVRRLQELDRELHGVSAELEKVAVLLEKRPLEAEHLLAHSDTIAHVCSLVERSSAELSTIHHEIEEAWRARRGPKVI